MKIGNIMRACRKAIELKKYMAVTDEYGYVLGYNPRLLNAKAIPKKDANLKS